MRTFFITLAIVLLTSVGVALLVFASSPTLGQSGVNLWIKSYQDYARTPMFTAFITLGSFLLTLKTAIIQRLKDAYDTNDYLNRYLILKQSRPAARYYGSLERLSVALATNVFFALTASILQMSLGFVSRSWATAICVGTAATTLMLLFYLTLQMFLAHKEWFNRIEEDKKKIVTEAEAEANLVK